MGAFFVVLFLIFLCFGTARSVVATTPPRGWNSYDSYTWIINESQVLENAQAVKQYLAASGYEYVVIDYLWFQDINDPSHLYIDQYGRLQPDPNRYPHSVNGAGFKWIGEQIHNMGLKFGIHIMRGISSAAVNAKSPVMGVTGVTAADIVETKSQCSWYNAVSSVDMSKNGAQQFYDSLYSQYAEWGVDFIKNDCVYGGNYVPDQIEAVAKAMDNSGREMAYSLSPGNYGPPENEAEFIHNITNMYRLTGDDWDNYGDITKHFKVVAEHAAAGLIGASGHDGGKSWPDSDMLPFGYITSAGSTKGPYKMTSLTEGQQRIQMSVWCIARSPLMFGGEVMALANDTFTRDLVTNQMALSVNYDSSNNRELKSSEYDRNGNPIAIKWAATQNKDFYVALVNAAGSNQRSMNATLNEITNDNSVKSCDYTDIWSGKTGTYTDSVQFDVASEDTAFLFLQNCT